jgi:dUTP pyrophosphatase
MQQFLKVQILSDTAKMPKREFFGDSGLDLYSAEQLLIPPGHRRIVGTGIAIELPETTEGQIRSRSGLVASKGIVVLNSPGTIDCGYRGEVKVVLMNFGDQDFEIKIGDKIAQLVVMPILLLELVETKNLTSSDRGKNGFGSTDK